MRILEGVGNWRVFVGCFNYIYRRLYRILNYITDSQHCTPIEPVGIISRVMVYKKAIIGMLLS